MQSQNEDNISTKGVSRIISKDRNSNSGQEIEDLLHCTECNYECTNKDVLLNHLKSHNVYACDKCDFRGISSKGLTAHKKMHRRKQFECSKCDYSGNTYSKLNIHMITHNNSSEEERNAELLLDVLSSQTSCKTPATSNTAKRGLSVSPEVVNDKKLLDNNSSTKKSKIQDIS